MTDSTGKTAKFDTPLSRLTEGVFEEGQLLGGKYRVISELGTGGMGTVYRVQQVFLHKEFALKTVHSRMVSDVLLQRFQLEAKAASSLSHPNLVQVHDFGVLDDGNPYLVMDLVDGITLAEYLKEQGPMPVNLVAPVFAQACFGLLAAHDKGVVHRDIKPGNIMILTDVPVDTEGCVKVLDFGIAKLTSNEAGEIQALTRTGEIFGSPLYMSPEQCTGGLVDHRSDIYSLGCVLFEMLTGTPPHLGQNALSTMMLHESGEVPTLREASLGKEFPQALEEIVDKMLRKSPSERYQNIGIVAHDLAAVCQRPGVAAASRQSKPMPAKPARVVSMPAGKFYLLLAMTALIPGSISALGGYSFKQSELSRSIAPTATTANSSAPKVDSKQDDQAQELNSGIATLPAAIDRLDQRSNHMSAKISEKPLKFGPIASITNKGKNIREFVFPNYPIGVLCKYRDGLDSDSELKAAKGKVDVPIEPLTLTVDSRTDAGLEPGIFNQIDAKDFNGLHLDDSNTSMKQVFVEKSSPSEQSPADRIAQILITASRWSNLEKVYLDTLTLNQSGLDALYKMKRLRYLTIVTVTIPPGLAYQPLPSLEQLAFRRGLGNIDGFVKTLARSPKLSRLELENVDQSVSFPLRELQQCKHLQYLQLSLNAKATDQFIRAATQFKSVTHVFIKETKLTDEQIQVLINCPWLTNISLSERNFSATDRARLRKLDGRIVFEHENS